MSTQVGSIHYDLTLNTKDFDEKSSKLNSTIGSIGDKLKSVGKKMTVAFTVPVVTGFGYAVKAASNLEETMNKVTVSFADQADDVKAWGKTAISTMGLAEQSALDAAALFGDMSTAMGLNTVEAKDMSKGLVQLGADLASFKNVSFERAQTALSGIYTGETEALKGLGIVMTEANLSAYAMSKGITKNIQDMTQAEKVQLRYAYVMSVTTNAQGDYVRTSDSTANKTRATQERFKELSTEIGVKLIPIMNRLLDFINVLITKFNSLSPSAQQTILALAGITAIIGPLLMGIGALVSGITATTTALTFLAAHPIILFIVALTAAVAALWLWWDKIPGAIQIILTVINPFLVLPIAIMKNWQPIMSWFSGFFGFIGDGFNSVKNFIENAAQKFRELPEVVRAAFSGIGSLILGPFKPAFDAIIGTIDRIMEKLRILKNEAKSGFEAGKAGGGGGGGGKGWAKGGYTGRGGVNEVAGIVHKGEYVLPQSMVDQNTGLPKMGGNNSTAIYGNINIGSQSDADYFFSKLARNQELSMRGLSTMTGTVG